MKKRINTRRNAAKPTPTADTGPRDEFGFPTDAPETATPAVPEAETFSLTETAEAVVSEPQPEPQPEPTVTGGNVPEPEPEGTTLRFVQLMYDIPSTARMDNPTAFLRSIGFRTTKSCWVIPEQVIPYTFIKEMREKHGCTVDVVRFDPSEGLHIMRMATKVFQKELDEQIARTLAGVKESEKKLTDVDEDGNTLVAAERDAEHQSYLDQCRRNLFKLRDHVKALENAMREFGIARDRVTLDNARNVFAEYQRAMKEKGDAYVQATNALRKSKNADAQGFAQAITASRDSIPIGIVADALREAGMDAEAERLLAKFAGAAVPDAVAAMMPTPGGGDDDTFPLTEAEDVDPAE